MKNNIKKYRELRGLSQEDLSEKTGMPQSALSRYERGEKKMITDTAQTIAQALNITLDEMFEEND